MKKLVIKKKKYKDEYILLEFYPFYKEPGIIGGEMTSGLIFYDDEDQYFFQNIIMHLIANYPEVLNIKMEDYEIKREEINWSDEWDSYHNETVTHFLGKDMVTILDHEYECKNITFKDFISELNKIAKKNKCKVEFYESDD